ncbi:hypothetical protein OIU84_014063 [Salix udensis]|uniref:Uncharacterized protein n=1 Tax=Salix udensis TaxID=889485 RepID=A0AAD6NQM7_9ROSI|nr:hypothetical protein OIU84_014063 [Salix udensis]
MVDYSGGPVCVRYSKQEVQAHLEAFSGLWGFFKLSLASAVMLCLETWCWASQSSLICCCSRELMLTDHLVVLSVLMLLSRHVISYAFTGGTEVAEAVAELSPFLAGTIVLGGVQPVLSGRLLYFTRAVNHGRSLRLAALVAYVNIACYYVIGIPLGCVLGLTCDMGTKGIWTGMLGGTIMQTIVLLWITFRTHWEKVEKAQNRLLTWNDMKEPLLKE